MLSGEGGNRVSVQSAGSDPGTRVSYHGWRVKGVCYIAQQTVRIELSVKPNHMSVTVDVVMGASQPVGVMHAA
jgi:hypothetical protein